jgi:hypothetical protein
MSMIDLLRKLGYQPQTSRQSLWQQQGSKTYITILISDKEPIACCNLYTFNNELLLSMDISLSKCPTELIVKALTQLTDLLGREPLPGLKPYVPKS